MTKSCRGLIDDTITIGIGGEAGQGVTRSGSLLGRAFTRSGLYAFGNIDYPSLIRGGHNYYTLRVAARKVRGFNDRYDLLLALNKETIGLHMAEMAPKGGLVYDSSLEVDEDSMVGLQLFPIPMGEIIKTIGGPSIMQNIVGLGAITCLLGGDLAVLESTIADEFRGRQRVVEMNIEAARQGWEAVKEHENSFECHVDMGERAKRLWLTGNEAVALGCLAAGCNFFAAYPMTPASPVLHWLASHDEASGMVVVQPESEIAAVGMALGASYAGAKAMTATSGGGFSLMVESLSLAAMTETPIVIMLAQRPGPSTGMATYSAQGDALFAIAAGHGEFPRVVLAPGDVEECYSFTVEAFNLAERFQVPVILLTDKTVVESHETAESLDPHPDSIYERLGEWEGGEYQRYQLTESGVSPMVVPGTKNALVLANSNEHTERGFTTTDPKLVTSMADKRFRKSPYIDEAVEKLQPVKVYGSAKAEITLVGWGSTKGPALESMHQLEEKGHSARFIQVRALEPFPSQIGELLEGAWVLVETNRTGLLGRLIKLYAGKTPAKTVLRYDGRPLTPLEIEAGALEVAP